jgi:hypothetical protein
MKKLFEIDENEKRRILEMHETATKNLYLSEQPTQTTPGQPQAGAEIEGQRYRLPGIVDKASLITFIGDNEYTPQELSELNDFLGTDLKMESNVGGSGLGKRALSVIRGSLNYLAQRVSNKESACQANYTDDNFASVTDFNEVKEEISDLTAKKLSAFVNLKSKNSQYCRS